MEGGYLPWTSIPLTLKQFYDFMLKMEKDTGGYGPFDL